MHVCMYVYMGGQLDVMQSITPRGAALSRLDHKCFSPFVMCVYFFFLKKSILYLSRTRPVKWQNNPQWTRGFWHVQNTHRIRVSQGLCWSVQKSRQARSSGWHRQTGDILNFQAVWQKQAKAELCSPQLFGASVTIPVTRLCKTAGHAYGRYRQRVKYD